MQTSKALKSIGEDNMINKKLSIVSKFVLKLVVLPMIIFTMVSCVKGTPSVDNDTNAPSLDEDSNTFIKGMADINTIGSRAYDFLFTTDSSAQKGSWIGYYKAADASNRIFKLNDDASGFQLTSINALKDSGLLANFTYDRGQLENLYINETTSFDIYLTDSKGTIVQEPSGSIEYSVLTKGGNIKVTDLVGVSPYLEPTLEGQEINLLIAYKGTNGKKYYIRYPLSFKYIG